MCYSVKNTAPEVKIHFHHLSSDKITFATLGCYLLLLEHSGFFFVCLFVFYCSFLPSLLPSFLPPLAPPFLLSFLFFFIWTLDFLADNDNNCVSPIYFIEFLHARTSNYCMCKNSKRCEFLPQLPDLPIILRKTTLIISFVSGNISLYKQAQKASWLEVVLPYVEESPELRKLSVF